MHLSDLRSVSPLAVKVVGISGYVETVATVGIVMIAKRVVMNDSRDMKDWRERKHIMALYRSLEK